MKVLTANTLMSIVGGYHSSDPAYYPAAGGAHYEVSRLKRDLNGFKKQTSDNYQELKNELADLRRELNEMKKTQNPE